jgi:hypothetical protein
MRTPVVVVCPSTKTYRVTYAEADRLLSKGFAYRVEKKLIRLKGEPSGEESIGRLRIRRSGRCGPMVVQYQRGGTYVKPVTPQNEFVAEAKSITQQAIRVDVSTRKVQEETRKCIGKGCNGVFHSNACLLARLN